MIAREYFSDGTTGVTGPRESTRRMRSDWFTLIVLLSLALSGCGGSSTSEGPRSPAPKATATAESGPGTTAAEPTSSTGGSPSKPVRLPVDPALVYVNRAYALYQAEKYDEALSALNKALELKENPATIHTLIGLIYDDKGETEEAATELEIALDLMPAQEILPIVHEKLLKLRLGLADRAKKGGNAERAEREYQKAMKLTRAPKGPLALAHAAHAMLLEEQGQKDIAVTEYRTATRIDPDYGTLPCALADLLRDTDATDEAISEYRRAIKSDPTLVDLRINLCDALLAVRRRSEAIAACLGALRIDPDSFDAHMNLGAAYGREGQLTKAIEQFREAVRLNPQSEQARANLNQALQIQQQKQ